MTPSYVQNWLEADGPWAEAYQLRVCRPVVCAVAYRPEHFLEVAVASRDTVLPFVRLADQNPCDTHWVAAGMPRDHSEVDAAIGQCLNIPAGSATGQQRHDDDLVIRAWLQPPCD